MEIFISNLATLEIVTIFLVAGLLQLICMLEGVEAREPVNENSDSNTAAALTKYCRKIWIGFAAAAVVGHGETVQTCCDIHCGKN